MKRFFSFFYTDLHWKLLSLLLAFAIWVVGTNMNNLDVNDSFDLRLRLVNDEILANEGLVIVNPEVLAIDVSVGVRATRREMEVLNDATPGRRAEMIVPSVDFRVVSLENVRNNDGPLTVRMYVGVNLYPGYEHFSITPRFVDIELDLITRQVFPVTIDVIGEVDSGVELRPIRLANSSVAITGSRTDVARINEDGVRVEVDIRGINFDIDMENLPLVVYDRDGNDVTNTFHLSVEETTAFVSVWPIETVDIRVDVTGDVAIGFALESENYVIEPDTIEVIAPASILKNLEYISVVVDLTDRAYSFTEEIDIREWLTDGVFLRSGVDYMIAVSVNIEPVDRWTFVIPSDDVRTRGFSVSYDILSEMPIIRIEVYGPRALLAEHSAADIMLEIDLRNLAVGTHMVPIRVVLPPGLYLAQPAPSLHVQINEPAADDDDEDIPTAQPVPYVPDEPTDDNTDVATDNNTGDTDGNTYEYGPAYDYAYPPYDAYMDYATPYDEETDD